ncbi:MAG: hypothetical protein M3081_02815 [Gemmatimonadota bacterium]|nr:hypothetical protein [Gemmatimonadota bacterium]
MDPGRSPKPLKSAVTHDGPANNVPSAKFHFETAAVAKAGKDLGKIYGVIGWGFDVSDKNKLTAHTVSFLSTAGTSFTDSVDAWNAQAAGPEANRMVKDQQKLGPLK